MTLVPLTEIKLTLSRSVVQVWFYSKRLFDVRLVCCCLDEEREHKIHIEIKPLSNGGAPMSASVDELRATVENISLSPIAILAVSTLLISSAI